MTSDRLPWWVPHKSAQAREERVPRDKRALCAAEVEEAGSVVPKRLTLSRRQSGRYRKGQVSWNGLKISIETPAGHWRIGKKPNGKLWMVKMRNSYGYIQRVKGYDGDCLDVFLGPHLESNLVFVINQNKPGTKEFDEHKVMIGWLTEAEARVAYLANFTNDWKGYAGCVKMTVDEFKAWARSDAAAGRAKAADARWLMPAALGVTGLGVDYAVNAGMRRSADTRAAAVGVMTPEQRTALNHASPGQSVMEVPGLKSPTYVSREDIETQLGAGLPLRRTAERQGLVLFDPQSTPAAYYAHELAHRDVPSWARSDTFSPLARGLANAASYGPGVYAGLASGRPLAGAAVGAMARLIGRSPAILEEFFAMRRAKQLIDYMPGTPEEKKLQRSALSRAFMTYIIPPVTSGALTGAAAGYAGRLMP